MKLLEIRPQIGDLLFNNNLKKIIKIVDVDISKFEFSFVCPNYNDNVYVRKINSCYEEFYKVPENALELELSTKNMINDDYSLGCLEIENKIFEKRNIERCKTFKVDLDEGGCFFELFKKLDDLRRKIIDNFGAWIKTNFVIYENELIVDIKYTEIESDEEYTKYVDHKKQDLKFDLLIKLNASKKYQDLVSKLFIKDF